MHRLDVYERPFVYDWPISLCISDGVLCHTKENPKVLARPFRQSDERDYDGELNTLIDHKVVRARPLPMGLDLTSSCGVLWYWRRSPSSTYSFVISRALALSLANRHVMNCLMKRVGRCPSLVVKAKANSSLRSSCPNCGKGSPHWRGYPWVLANFEEHPPHRQQSRKERSQPPGQHHLS